MIGFRDILLIILFISCILLRITQLGGLNDSPESITLEEFAGNFQEFRQALSYQAQHLLPQPQAGLLAGMVFGERASLPFDFSGALKNTSTIHIVVVSGQNLTLLAGFILALSPYLGRRKVIGISLVAVIFYAVLTGLQIPVLRAAVMVLLTSMAQLFKREGQGMRILFIAAGSMLIFNPNWINSISFQLSVLATMGVILSPELISRFTFLPRFIREDVGVSLAAQLLTWPIIAMNFNQVTMIGVLVNSLILWVVPIVMIFGALSIFTSFSSLFLGSVIALIPGVLLTYFVYIVNFFNQGWGRMYVGEVNLFIWLGYYLVLFGFFQFLRKSNALRSVSA